MLFRSTVELAGETPGELAERLVHHGFALRFPLGARAETARLLPMVHGPSGVPLDLVIAAPGLDEEFLARAELVDLGDVEVPVISAEDLIALKVLAGRRKDLEDVRGVLLEKGDRLDLSRTRDVLRAFEAVTGEPKLLKRLARLVRASGRKTV